MMSELVAKQKYDMVIYKDYDNVYDIWMDEDIVKKVRNLPGVYKIFEYDKPKYIVYIDKRYEEREVLNSIEALVLRDE